MVSSQKDINLIFMIAETPIILGKQTFSSMAQSVSHLIVHAVFSTKDRRPFLHSEEIRIETYAYHRKFSYQEELRELLKRHRGAFDERYLWE
jgi:hypothetical protein